MDRDAGGLQRGVGVEQRPERAAETDQPINKHLLEAPGRASSRSQRPSGRSPSGKVPLQPPSTYAAVIS